MNINGIMIDCSRCIEKHEYYFQLIDFMADWGMNTLLFHFSDDHGLAIKLDGFEDISKPHSFTVDEIRKLIEYASQRDIDIIPEIETFGHTRYLTTQPQYKHLSIAPEKGTYTFTAINPLNAETYELMDKLIRSTAELFPSKYLHIGCDEVNLEDYCKQRNLNSSDVWSGYVNRIIQLTKQAGKIPMIWADHLENDEKIANAIDKDIIVISWAYNSDVTDDAIKKLKSAGFSEIIAAPSIACYFSRFLPSELNLQNVKLMAEYTRKHDLMGMITTIWCPYRYFQKTMFYGIAYSAYLMQNASEFELEKFHKAFVKKVFDTPLDRSVAEFLADLPKMHPPIEFFWQYMKEQRKPDAKIIEAIRKTNELGGKLLPLAEKYQPATNIDIWQEMILAAKSLQACSEGYFTFEQDNSPTRKAEFRRTIENLYKSACEIWDRDRFSDDQAKIQSAFKKGEEEYALLILRWFADKAKKI